MGDRGNIIIEKDNGMFPAPVFFYTHWNGSGVKTTLQEALKRGKERWTDGAYLARIIFNQLTDGSEMELTGFGISTAIGDGGTEIFMNIEEQKVRERDSGKPDSKITKEWTFEEFVALDLDAETEDDEEKE